MRRKKTSSIFSVPVVFIIIVTALSAAAFISLIIYQSLYKDLVLNRTSRSSVNHVDIRKRLMESHFRAIESDLLFLPRLNEVLRFKEIKTEEERMLIEQEFLEFISSDNLYDQIRYIDKNGIELTRVNLNDGRPSAAPENQLQDKSDRYYFRETISLEEGLIYISPFDLNVEHGKIEQPLKPMIRFGTPIYNNSGTVAGIVILNFLGQIIIDDLIEATESYPGTFSLLNPDGYWLYNNNPEQEWGFMFPERKDENLKSMNPQLWAQLIESDHNQLLTDEVIYTAVKVPLLQNDKNIEAKHYYMLLNTISLEELKIDSRTLNNIRIKVMAAVILLNSLIGIFLSRIIVQRNRYRAALKESALYDQLTGLPNRNLLEQRATHAAALAKRYGHSYAVLFIDLDGFKPVNDNFGHKAGDELLIQVGSLLESCIRETDTAARFGGDEFVILLSQIQKGQDSSAVAEKILSKFFREFDIEGEKIRIGASIGIAEISPDSDKDFESAMLAADAAMYDVKKTGKNNFRIVEI